MAIKTYTQQLEEVQTKITAILTPTGSQSYVYKDLQKREADLAVLYAQENRLMPLAQRESAGRTGARVRYVEVG
jgi:hypothetical protein